MLILLPPSEGKATPVDGPPVDFGALSFGDLAPTREKVLRALIRLCTGARNRRRAREVLGLSERQVDAIDRNGALWTAPTLPAAELYTGVLYDHVEASTLPATAAESVVIVSALWGALRLTDRIPPYRLSMDSRLPPIGGLAAFWRPAMTRVFSPEEGLVVDLRSSTYAAAWNPGEGGVAIRVVRDHGGHRTVVSHMAKATRGLVARSLLVAGAQPSTPTELADTLRDLKWTVESHEPERAGKPWRFDVIIAD